MPYAPLLCCQLADLQRKYRIMEGNRKSYSDDSQAVIKKQRVAIEQVKDENAALRHEIELLSQADVGGISSAATVQQEMAKLQEQVEAYTRKIEAERKRLEELEEKMGAMSTKAMDTRRQMGGVNAGKESSLAVNKQVKQLENRLEKALVKFNEALSQNKVLRDQIDNLRRERVVFDTLYKKMEKELHDKKREMANVIEISNIAYEARDQAQNEMAALKAQADKEQAAFEAEMREMQKLIDSQHRMRDFLKMSRADAQPGAPTDRGDVGASRGAGGGGRERSGRSDYVNLFGNNGICRRLEVGEWAVGQRTDAPGAWKSVNGRSGSGPTHQVQSYEEAFEKIHQATGIQDIDELVTMFISAEDKNFSLFNYVNELNQELEKLEEQLADTRLEIEKYKGQGASHDSARKKILLELEERLNRTEEREAQYEVRFQKTMKAIAHIKQVVTSTFNKIGCNTAAVREMLGDGGVTESNLMLYLGIIEQRTNEILQMYAIHMARQRGKDLDDGLSAVPRGDPLRPSGMLLVAGPLAPPGSVHVGIEPPSTGDDYASDDDSDEEVDDRPMTREELEDRTITRIRKREASGRSRMGRRMQKPK
ncbi:hypothetical protein KFL_001330270 [Klebsormidium nitens]|uniref:ODAD1 central coiled coil region domain-containing protein n=1 Tax=Klebsormidium nitens TaxID=105231 RepID=A0A0U9HLJ0_KLENI|nr:hypothetical protein KFL_001330270 [Klebsormidium nitens]|eukprot:GAQ83044.1 hypothetical protein KFL_001330270 [Klebsormidium nitens]